LDRQLPPERGPSGQPSAHDFHVFELLRAVEEFAVGFDTLPELIPGRPEYRILITAGRIVASYSIVGQLAADGAVELIELEVDDGRGWLLDDDERD
jgi:hypothetical protein